MKHRFLQKNNLIALAAVLLVGLAYLSTLMLTVNGSDSDYAADTGEFQVALPLWGTVHMTGYPLYMMLGSPFVVALKWLGVPPSAGASVFSMVWALVAVYVTARLLYSFTPNSGLALVGAAAFGLTTSMWIHASLAEVYSLSIALLVIVLALTLRLLQGWDDRLGWLLAFVGGLGVAHHRIIAVALPAVGLILLPLWLKSGKPSRVARWLLVSIFFFAIGFLPYLDMPWRVWLGSTWNYGQPATWDGFWFIFWGTEVKDWQKPVFDLAINLANLRDIIVVLAEELTWIGLVAATVALGLALWNKATRLPAVLLTGMCACLILFTVLTRKAVLLQADLMPVVLCLILGLGLGFKIILDLWPALNRWGGALLIWPIALFILNRPTVTAITQNPDGVNYVNLIEQHLDAPQGSVVMAPWGRRYFALSYASRVAGQMPGWIIVDHRADFATLTKTTGRAYTAADSFYIFTAQDFWAPRLGGAYLSSAGSGLVEIRRTPEQRDPNVPITPLGDSLALVDMKVTPLDSSGTVDVTLWWTATAKPAYDYSTFVHVSDADAISSDADVIAQNDEVAPVYAWYPTTLWSPNELVRDDHTLTLPAARPAKLISVGLYRQDASGNFLNLGSVDFINQNGVWVKR
jgi:Protein of unknown function (DUF2723)